MRLFQALATGGRSSTCVPEALQSRLASCSATSTPPVASGSTRRSEWPGLKDWRRAFDRRRGLGHKGITQEVVPVWDQQALSSDTPALASTLAEQAVQVLLTPDPGAKAALTHRIYQQLQASQSTDVGKARPPDRPSRCDRVQLVSALEMPKPKDSGLPLAVYMLHQLAHVELNAIDLAWDTVARFSHLQLPKEFYLDFARVADDEGRHLGWCLQRLQELGYDYGDMPAHDLLWEGCRASACDVTARLAVVPMSQEARGLDAGPRLVSRLVGLGDNRSAAIVRRIAEEERAHVAVGVDWFSKVCSVLGHDEASLYRQHLSAVNPDASILKGPFNAKDRLLVGLRPEHYDVDQWPTTDRHQLLNSKYLGGPSYRVLEEPFLTDADVALLRQRLGTFCEVECSAASS